MKKIVKIENENKLINNKSKLKMKIINNFELKKKKKRNKLIYIAIQ